MASLFRLVKLLPGQGMLYSKGKEYLGQGIRGNLSHTLQKELQKRIDNQNETERPTFRAVVAVHSIRLSSVIGKHLLESSVGCYHLGAQGTGVEEMLREGDEVECYKTNTPSSELVTIRALVRLSEDDEHLEKVQAGNVLKNEKIPKLQKDNKITYEAAVYKFVSENNRKQS